ncbi:MAG: ATP-grasp domain-containing protein [Minisyncoccia bacterium]
MTTVFSPLPASLRIGVIRGGPTSEYEKSILSGGKVLEHLHETHKPIDIFISRDGKWHIQGVERPPERILKNVDVVWNAVHGEFGEDGQIQDILGRHGVPYTGSLKYQSAIALNKQATKEMAKTIGIRTPIFSTIRQNDKVQKKIKEIIHSIPYPLMVKPVRGGSSIGLRIAKSQTELLQSIEAILTTGSGVLVEEYIPGKNASCGVISYFRGDDLYTLPPVEIITGVTEKEDREVCPGNFSEAEKREIEKISALIHGKLGLGHYSKSDFVVSPRRGIYFLEINTLPKFGNSSTLTKSLEAVGISTKEFIHHMISLALYKK